MPVKKRSTVGEETYDEPTAIEKLTSTGQAARAEREGEQPGEIKQARIHKPTSFYLDDETLRKLDRLAFQYNEEKRTRVNRNHIVRFLAAGVELGDLLRVDLKAY